jgi:hypothetical protein
LQDVELKGVKMYFEQVRLEKVLEQIAKGEISPLASNDEQPESYREALDQESIRREAGSTPKLDEKERWLRLCEMAAVEQDSQKLLSLVKEITSLLDKKMA